VFEIEMLPARQGDALWLEYGDSAHPRRALIDAGTPETWAALSARIAALAPDDRHFELLIVSHIDKDHIGGVLPLLEDSTLGVTFGDVWFNGFRHLPSTTEPMGPIEGERLTTLLVEGHHRWNHAFDEQAVVVTDDGPLPVKQLDGGLQLTVLSPGLPQLAKLRPVWEPLVREHGLDPAVEAVVPEPLPPELESLGALSVEELAAKKFKADSAEANGSSIVVLAEFEGRRALLCADGFPEVIRASVERLLDDGAERLPLDAFKLPHHGSRANLNLELLRRVSAPLHLISSDGTATRHPNPEAIARTIVTQDHPRLRFNYRTKYTELWEPRDVRGAAWEAEFPAAGASGLTVKLDA
jgi:hypothetical protein